MERRPAAVVAGITLTFSLALLPGAASARARARPYDFNGDGYPELVVGTPYLQVRSHLAAGGVVVLRGFRSGVSTKGRVITQSSHGVVGSSEDQDQFGAAVASADFNRDGYADLAIGAPGEKIGNDPGGAVTILYGSRTGLRGKGSVRLSQPKGTTTSSGSVGGDSVAAADFTGDGWPDLAVGNLGADLVRVFRGGRSGFSMSRSSVVRTLQSGSEFGIGFGSALAAGDLDGDGRTDLAIASEGASYDDGDGSDGAVTACFGTSKGLSDCVLLVESADFAGLASVAVGNVSGDKRPEIVAGVPAAEEQDEPGVVQTLSLSGRGTATKATISSLTQGTLGLPEDVYGEDRFGSDVALGDLDHDGFDDLVVGSPGQTVGNQRYAGRVVVVDGGRTGYRTHAAAVYDQDTAGVPGKAEPLDAFGGALALADHDRDGHLDLAIGAPGENDYSGGVTTLRGHGAAFTPRGAHTFGLRSVGYPQRDHAEFGLTFGR